MKCNLCGHVTDLQTIGFKAVCQGCGEYLHTCVQCRLYDAGGDRCRSMTTEPVRDRGGNNYCEEFRPGGVEEVSGGARKHGGAADFEKLFGGDCPEDGEDQ